MSRWKSDIILIIKGGLMGIANIIPGVSGGTIAVVVGIYEDLIEAIGDFFSNREKRREYLLLLFKVFLGAGIAILALARLMDYLLEHHHIFTYLFFIGLIVGSIPSIYRTHPDMRLTPLSAMSFVLGVAIILFFSLGFPENSPEVNRQQMVTMTPLVALWLFISGILSGGSMIVPGISGSFMLVLLGQYHNVIRAVSHFQIIPLMFLGAGIALGVWLFARIIEICLKHYPRETFYFILGLVIASIYPIFPGLPNGVGNVVLAAIITIIGALISFTLGQYRE